MKKGLIKIMISNIVCLIISLVLSYILPKYLSIDSYAYIKTYALYIGYAGFFHLGYADGMYLKFGGKKIEKIEKQDLADNCVNYFVLESVVATIILAMALATKSEMLIPFSFGLFSYNILSYMKSLYQATGEFSLYGLVLNLEKLIVFIIDIILIFVVKTDCWKYYVWGQVFIGIGICFFLLKKLENRIHFIGLGKIKRKEISYNVNLGFVLMIGNFSSTFFTGIDRWFVKLLMTTTNFALYSFATSMESMINLFISPITISLYNYFCKDHDVKNIKNTKKMVLLWGLWVITAAYPAKFIVNNFLEKYVDASTVIFFLFGTQVFYVVIKGIYVNIYKAEKKQNQYLMQVLVMTVFAVILNIIFYSINKSMNSIALATFVTSILWLLLCEYDRKELRFQCKEIVAVVIMMSTFIYTGCYMNAVVGLLLYMFVGICVGFALLKDTYLKMWEYIVDILKTSMKNVVFNR